VEDRGVIGAETVALRPEAAAEPGEARHVPQVRKELLDLRLEIVEVAPMPGHRGSIPA
jgi:hypothetical protein